MKVTARTNAQADRLRLKAAPNIQMIPNHNRRDSASREFSTERIGASINYDILHPPHRPSSIALVNRVGATTSAGAPADRVVLLCERPLGAIHYRIIALCFAAWIFDFYDLILYSFMVVPIARDLHLSQTQSSLTLGLALAMTAIGGVVFGFVGDRFGRKPTIIVAVLIYGVGTTLCAASHSLLQLLVFRSFTGLGIGGEWAAGQSLVAETVPPARRARYAAYVQVGAPLGAMLAAAVGGHLEPLIGWRNVFLLSSAPSFFVAAIVWRWLPESDVWLRNGLAAPAASRRVFGAASVDALRPYRRIVGLLFVVLLVNSAAYWFTYTWMPSYLRIARKLSPQASGNLMVWMQAGALVGYSAFGALADHFGRRPVFSFYASLMAIGLLPATLFWDWAAATHGLIRAALIVAGFGTGIWAGAGPMISELLPTSVRNTALGLLLNVTRGIQFFTPLIITALSPRLGFGPTLAIGALFSAIGAAMVWLLPETRGRHITDLDPAR
jgi:MFS family permease